MYVHASFIFTDNKTLHKYKKECGNTKLVQMWKMYKAIANYITLH